MTSSRAPRCKREIDGPEHGRIVEWRRRCQVRTRHPSGLCRFHRGPHPCWVGEPQWAHDAHVARQRELEHAEEARRARS